ncbi:hypothetical protein [Leucobacter tenebrionis]|uniref:hypothetical protein n=1 Tax=Leucobacter tenebrionis TaxID=2873270 RepID=UPI001CA6378A|nr:hypothetical protein [Leucobacter tenebrionis]QZY52379.1 hypothetical protein KVY00_02620 [Leucobacter tenebrionis]
MELALGDRLAAASCGLLLIASLTGCAAAGESDGNDVPTQPSSSAPAEPSTPAAPEPSTEPGQTAEEAFLAWLAASREPDAQAACASLSDGLVERMLTEMQASGMPVSDCTTMITTTAELYAALGQSAEVEIDSIAETENTAELFVTYTGGSSCGRVALERVGTDWIITENSEEVCA